MFASVSGPVLLSNSSCLELPSRLYRSTSLGSHSPPRGVGAAKLPSDFCSSGAGVQECKRVVDHDEPD